MDDVAVVPLVPAHLPIPLEPLGEWPLVSVFISNYNYAAYVGRAIESVLAQTYPYLEVIVCDDGSTDGSLEVIDAYAREDSRVRVVRKANGGQASAFNAAYEVSRGAVICLLDSDDAFYPEKVARVVAYLREHSDRGYVHHPMMLVDVEGRELQRKPLVMALEEGRLVERVRRRGGAWRWNPTSAIAFRREVAEYIFPVPEQPGLWPDGYVALLAAYLTTIGYIECTLSQYRDHGANSMGERMSSSHTAHHIIEVNVAQILEANHRISAWGLQDWRLELSQNPSLLSQRFQILLFESAPRRQLLREFLSTCPVLLKNDLVERRVRLVRPLVYALAIVLPLSVRTKVLEQALGRSKVKELIFRLLHVLGRTG
jgi:hypothetical protein